MSGFEVRWLDLREAADHAARDAGLRRRTIDYLGTIEADATVVDLGCGTGSTFRALQPEAEQWRWRLLDNDPLLLAEALARHGAIGRVECVESDLDAFPPDLLDGVGLVTASALFDLVSDAFLVRLVEMLARTRSGLYTALNYDGHCRWEIPLSADAQIVAAFNMHQVSDKGFGPALGPSAITVLQKLLLAAGYEMAVASSPWRLGAGEAELQRQLLAGMAQAVAETGLVDATIVEDWLRDRVELAGRSGCEVGHWDMLALPHR